MNVSSSRGLPPVKMVALGDSLTAGSQDGTTVVDRQDHGWAQLLADSAGVPWRPAYISEPGIPFDIFVKGKSADIKHIADEQDHLHKFLAPLGLYTYFIGAPPILFPIWDWIGEGHRVDGTRSPITNFAVPGFESRHLLTIGSARDMLKEIHQHTMELKGVGEEVPNTRAVLGTYSLGGGGSSVDRTIASHPDLVLLWAGGNDALSAIFKGYLDDRSLTPMDDRQWTFRDQNPLTGHTFERTTRDVMPGFESTWLGPNGIAERLLKGTKAEIMLMTVPDATVIASLRTLGEKVGPLPFRVVLPDGTDVTHQMENWTIPTGVLGDGKNGRKTFPTGTKAPLFTVLSAFVRTMAVKNVASFTARLNEPAMFHEDDVMDPDELKTVADRIDQFNGVLKRVASLSPRVHLVDVNAELHQIMKGRHLTGSGPEDVVVTTTFTGVKDHGMDGIFSFDGVHPSDTGHAVIANFLLENIQKDLGSDPRFARFMAATPVDEKAVFRGDPHRQGQQFTLLLDAPHVEAARTRML